MLHPSLILYYNIGLTHMRNLSYLIKVWRKREYRFCRAFMSEVYHRRLYGLMDVLGGLLFFPYHIQEIRESF